MIREKFEISHDNISLRHSHSLGGIGKTVTRRLIGASYYHNGIYKRIRDVAHNGVRRMEMPRRVPVNDYQQQVEKEKDRGQSTTF